MAAVQTPGLAVWPGEAGGGDWGLWVQISFETFFLTYSNPTSSKSMGFSMGLFIPNAVTKPPRMDGQNWLSPSRMTSSS